MECAILFPAGSFTLSQDDMMFEDISTYFPLIVFAFFMYFVVSQLFDPKKLFGRAAQKLGSFSYKKGIHTITLNVYALEKQSPRDQNVIGLDIRRVAALGFQIQTFEMRKDQAQYLIKMLQREID